MGKYTLRISGKPIEDAREVLAATDGVSAPAAGAVQLTVTVDAPSLAEAEQRVDEALPAHGSYVLARPEPLEDEDDD